MRQYTQEEFNRFPVDEYGRRQCPTGDYTLITKFIGRCLFSEGCLFGDNAIFDSDCSFGEMCEFGAECLFGMSCSFGRLCSFKERCSLGKFCSFGNMCSFSEHCSFDVICSFGERCVFDKGCSFGECCSFGVWCYFNEHCKCEFGEFKTMYTVGGFGSKRRTTYFFHMTDGGVCVRCGCFAGTIDEWESEVRRTHGVTPYAQAYLLIGAAVRAMCQR